MADVLSAAIAQSKPAVADQQDDILNAILGRMKPLNDEEARPSLKILLFSHPGGRKTSFLGGIGDNLIIDSEDGLTSLYAIPELVKWDTTQVIPFKSFFQVEKLTEGLAKNAPQLEWVKTVSVDTLTTLHKKGLAEEVKRMHLKGMRESIYKAEGEDHGVNNERMRQIVDGLKDLNRNIVVTCHAKEVQQKDKSIKIYPDFSDKLANTINGMMDVVAFVEQTQNGVVWHNISDGYIQCKNRIGLPQTLENPTWETIWGYFEKHLANSKSVTNPNTDASIASTTKE